ncbi:restriction endonuclease subunit S [Nitrosomonas sp. Nm58]|uniref:restriction endonuclease subunit S n=1 Tax=Nitrosomonas sp. Nm58 TaxID=200126 RepID=UPI000894B0CE|nr:restriction endonuclease subunit S [Nitrosomonas sp. Nm58]SDY20072.1 type I restriction enzyme, S subunit [Nitrosomonas sp. Nm58]
MDYKEYPFGELVEKWIDNRGKTPPLADSGIPLLEVKHLPESGIYPLLEGTKFVSKETYKSWFRAYLQPMDILFSTVGTTARVTLTPDFPIVAIAQNVLGIRFKEELVDPVYMFYYMRGKQFQHDIEARLVTTVQASIKRADMVGIPVSLPTKDTQRSIAEKAISFDKKIELNRRMNETLEAIARAIFKSWFVDFDPVRAKAQGESPESICRRLRLTPDLLALFPDRFVDSELGEIPEGWEVKPFSEIVQIIGGGTPKTSVAGYWGGDISWFSVVDAPAESDVFVIDTEKKITQAGLDNSSARILSVGTTIISARGTVGKVALVGMPMAMNQSCYGLRGLDGSTFFTYYATRELVATLKQHSHGAVFDTITRDTFAGVHVVTFQAVATAFEAVIAPLMGKIKANSTQRRTLAELRDALLPKLLSDELRVPETVDTV